MDRSTLSLLKTLAVVICGVIFLAASCEQKKADPKPKSQTTTAATDVGEALDANEPPGAFEKKEPRSVGPDAPALFMLSGLKGYTEPCGCTLDVMLGGIDRIAGYVGRARKLYPAVDFVDGGDLLFEAKTVEEHELAQEKAKVDLVVTGLADMKVAATVPGELDFALGTAFYLEQVKKAGITPIAANLQISGDALSPTRTTTVDGIEILYVGIVDPELYEEIEGVETSDPTAALKKLIPQIESADVAILLAHGEVPFAKSMLEAAPGADFALVGHGPRETDQTDAVGDAHTLEPYDQGRYLGILKLFNARDASKQSFANARTGSKAELEKIDRQIEHVNESLNRVPPATPGEEPPMLLTLRQRLERLEDRRKEIKNSAVEVPADTPAFAWRAVALEPGYEPDQKIAAARAAYNEKLRELNDIDREVPPTPEGTPQFIGTNQCATCHAPAMKFWEETAHAKAVPTLEERNKAFDQKCIGCHVVGYEQPGGSVLGKLEYDAQIDIGEQKEEIHKDLRNVGCESCHGPGEFHRAEPLDGEGKPQHIIADPAEAQCAQCHVPDHSPRFRFDVYVEQITGEGHERN